MFSFFFLSLHPFYRSFIPSLRLILILFLFIFNFKIERLEEERLQLKKKLRKQALHRGQRAVELGLTVEDLAVAERSDEEDAIELPVTKTTTEPGV